MNARLQRDWALIARDYMAGEAGVDDLCARHRISRRMLCRRARQFGWDRRRRRGQTVSERMTHLLHRALRLCLAGLENRKFEDGALSAAECEREVRILAALARLIEKHDRLSQRLPAAEGGKTSERSGGQTAAEPVENADAFRQKLAERLGALAERWLTKEDVESWLETCRQRKTKDRAVAPILPVGSYPDL